MLRVIMLISAVIAAFLVVTRFVSIPGLPVLEDQTLIGIVLTLVLLFGVAGAVLSTPPDAQAAYASRLRRFGATLFLLFCIVIIAALAVWFLHYYGPPEVQKQFSF
jgi:O-antigen ligase